ncbi:MAG: DUF4238 domain-containing protein [Methanosarcina sp.]
MAKNKNQHIVPQHYLRGFSKDRDNKCKNAEKRICRYNIRKPVKPYAAIKNTCIYSYFYVTEDGFNKVDEVIKSFEDIHAPILDELINKQELPLDFDKIGVLYTFIMLLHTRTKSAREHAMEIEKSIYTEEAQEMLKKLGYPNHIAKVAIDPLEAQFNMMKPSILSSYALDDLSQVLLINESQKKFITSDNPVVFYNYKMTKNKCLIDAKCSGLMIFCPLTENLLLLLFDGNLYDVHMDTPTTVRLKEETDIDSINKLQLLKCYEEIYCYDENELEYIKELHRNVKDQTSNLIDISYRIKLSFLKLNDKNNRRYKAIIRHYKKNNIPLFVTRNTLLAFKK